MSIFGKTPVQDIAQGEAAFAADLRRFLGQRTLDEVGWAMPDGLTLLVPLFGTRTDGSKDPYLLRLFFDHYPTWPPSALFVNPLTLSYKFPDDVLWVPQAANHQEIAFHTNYPGNTQLVCCSLTLEFYKVNHSVQEAVIWRAEEHKFTSTLAATKRALIPPYYVGRSKQ
jgi:hypothetical protein